MTHFPSTKLYSVKLSRRYDYDACNSTFLGPVCVMGATLYVALGSGSCSKYFMILSVGKFDLT